MKCLFPTVDASDVIRTQCVFGSYGCCQHCGTRAPFVHVNLTFDRDAEQFPVTDIDHRVGRGWNVRIEGDLIEPADCTLLKLDQRGCVWLPYDEALDTESLDGREVYQRRLAKCALWARVRAIHVY